MSDDGDFDGYVVLARERLSFGNSSRLRRDYTFGPYESQEIAELAKNQINMSAAYDGGAVVCGIRKWKP